MAKSQEDLFEEKQYEQSEINLITIFWRFSSKKKLN